MIVVEVDVKMKNVTKRSFAILLSLAMVLSFIVLPVKAVAVPTVTLSTVSFTEATKTIPVEGTNVESVNTGDKIAVKVLFTNTTGKTIFLSGFSIRLKYNTNVFRTYTYSYIDPENGSTTVGPVAFAGAAAGIPNSWSGSSSNSTEGSVQWARTGTSYKEIVTGGTAILGYLLLQVKDTAESCSTEINFDHSFDTSTNIDNYVKSAESLSDTSDEDIDGVDFSATNKATVSINGVVPTISKVMLSGQNAATVSVSGGDSEAQTVNATATSQQGTDITTKVAWSVSPADKGVTINASTGVISVGAKTAADSYTVTATPVSGKTQGEAKNAALTVTHAASSPVSVAVTGDNEIRIPTGSEATTAQFTAAVTDQFDGTMSNPSITWSIAPEINGVSINSSTGALSVESTAKNAIDASTTLTITATCGEKTGTKIITVKRADSVATAIAISGGTATIAVPEILAYNGASIVRGSAYTAAVTDQYGSTMSGQTVAWSIADAPTGVSIDASGVVSVTNEAAAANSVTVTATCGSATNTAAFAITKATSAARFVTVCKDGAAITADTVVRPVSGDSKTVTYAAKTYDQFGGEMTGMQTYTWEQSGSLPDHVTFSDGTVTVPTTAGVGSFTIQAANNSISSGSVTITVTNLKADWSSITVVNGTYGDTNAGLVSGTGATELPYNTDGSEIYNETLTGSFAITDEDTVQDAGESRTITITFTADNSTANGAYANVALTKVYTVTIAKKSVTVSGITADNKVYDGTDNATLAYTDVNYSGILTGDDLGVATTGTFSDANAGTGKTVTLGTLTLSGTDVDNYTLSTNSQKTATADITPKPVTLTWNDYSNLTYDGNAKNVTATAGDLVSGDNCTVTVTGGTQTNAGGYTATATGLSNQNYKLPGSGTTQPYTIQKKPVTVTAATVSGVLIAYTGAQVKPALNITCTDELTINTDYTITYRDNINAGDNASYTVAPVDSSNYTFVAVTNHFTISPAVLTVKFVDMTLYVGDTFNPRLSVTGFKTESDVENSITADPTVTGSTQAAGVFTLTPEGGAATNYTFKYESGVLTVLDKMAVTAKAIDKTNLSDTLKNELKNEGKYTVTQGVWTDPNTYDVTIKATSSLVSYPSSDAAQGEGQWVAVILRDLKPNGNDAANMTNVKYSFDGTTYHPITEADVAEAATLGESNAIVVWLKADKSFTDNKMTICLKIGENGTPVKLNLKYVPYRAPSGAVSSDNVIISASSDGKVKADTYNAKTGEKVTLTVTPSEGKALDSLVVTDKYGNPVKVTKNADGTYSFIMPEGYANVKATYKDAAGKLPFTDVPESAWYYDDVAYVYENGLMNGTGNLFMPQSLTTRAQVVTILWRMAGSPAAAKDAGFTDLTQAWYKTAVNWAAANGIATGIGGSRFDPDGSVTREQFAAFLYRYAEFLGKDVSASDSLASFTDSASVSAWALKAVKWAVADDIISGSNGRLMPASGATRAELAAMFTRFSKLVG